MAIKEQIPLGLGIGAIVATMLFGTCRTERTMERQYKQLGATDAAGVRERYTAGSMTPTSGSTTPTNGSATPTSGSTTRTGGSTIFKRRWERSATTSESCGASTSHGTAVARPSVD